MDVSVPSLLLKSVYVFGAIYLVVRAVAWLAKYFYQVKVINRMKGLPIIPFVGNAHQFAKREQFLKWISGLSRQFKDEPVFRIWIGWEPFTVFHKADYVDIMVGTQKNNEKSVVYKFLHPWLNRGLLTSYGDKWQSRRRLLTPSFHFEILNDFLHVMNEQAEIMVEIMAKKVKEDSTVDVFQRIAKCALDIICETAMGQHVNAQTDEDSKYVKAVCKISELIVQRQYNPLHWTDFVYNRTKAGKEHQECLDILQGFTRKVILERDAEFDETSAASQKRVAFLDVLLKAKHLDASITFEDIQEEVDTFMFEGHDTTAAAASWACQLIGSHPDVQKKLHEEIDSVFGNSARSVTNDDIRDMKYLECVVKETLRLFPSVPFFARRISDDDEVGGYKILKDGSSIIFAYMIHRDEKYYPNPEKFDPDRFLPENSKDRHPYAYIPFSAGRRNCIGQKFAMMEEKVLLANILRHFELKSLKTIDELCPVSDLIVRPLNGIPIELKLRGK